MREALRLQRFRDWGVAIALAALFSFTGIANHPLQASDEPRVAGIAWEMQHSGQWWVPHLAGEPFLEHPPLFYALLGACIEHLGATDGVARLPGAIASALTMLLVFALARRVGGAGAGLPALLALVGTAGFFRYSHRAIVDPLLMLFVMLGYAAYVCAVWAAPDRGHRERVAPGWLVLVYLAAALAFWVKGWIGVAAIGVPLAIDVVVARRSRVLASPAHLAGLPLLLAACAAWPLVLYGAEGEAAVRTFLLNNGWYRIAPGAAAGRYIGGHVRPFWYYVPMLFTQVGWIALFVPAVAVWLWRGAAPPAWNLPALRFLACILPLGALLLSLAGTKRALYLLPFEPPLAIAVGAWIAAAARGEQRSRIEAALSSACARVADALLHPVAVRLGSAGRRAAADLRGEVPRAGVGPCRAPLRVAALAFAVAIAWNLAVTPLSRRGNELGPMAREVGDRVGAQPLLAVQLDEAVLGALPFYAGNVPIYVVHDPETLARQLQEVEARFLLAPDTLRERIAGELGGVQPTQTWVAAGDGYALYAIPPAQNAGLGPPRDPESRLD